jgi:hypothetical protein
MHYLQYKIFTFGFLLEHVTFFNSQMRLIHSNAKIPTIQVMPITIYSLKIHIKFLVDDKALINQNPN